VKIVVLAIVIFVLVKAVEHDPAILQRTVGQMFSCVMYVLGQIFESVIGPVFKPVVAIIGIIFGFRIMLSGLKK